MIFIMYGLLTGLYSMRLTIAEEVLSKNVR